MILLDVVSTYAITFMSSGDVVLMLRVTFLIVLDVVVMLKVTSAYIHAKSLMCPSTISPYAVLTGVGRRMRSDAWCSSDHVLREPYPEPSAHHPSPSRCIGCCCRPTAHQRDRGEEPLLPPPPPPQSSTPLMSG